MEWNSRFEVKGKPNMKDEELDEEDEDETDWEEE